MYNRPLDQDLNKVIELFTGPLMAFFIVIIVLFIAIRLVILIGKIKLFIKSGQAWWKAIIPFYSSYVLIVKIAGLHWAFFVLSITMFFKLYSVLLTYFVWAMTFYNLGKRFNRDIAAATIFGTLFSGLVIAIYGYNSKIVYDPNVKVNNCSFFEKVIK